MKIMWPCDRNNVWITDDWSEHLQRPGYNRAYAGTDLAGPEQPLNPSQYNGKVLQAMWSNAGYGYTTFVEHYDPSGKAVLRIRNAHQKKSSRINWRYCPAWRFTGNNGQHGKFHWHAYTLGSMAGHQWTVAEY